MQAQLAALQQTKAKTSPSPAFAFTRTLSRGMKGDDVKTLQRFLNSQYSNFTLDYITGYFGALTEAAVKQWQKEHNIVSFGSPSTTGYGVVGPKTRAMIAVRCR